MIEQMDEIATSDAVARKARSMSILKAQDVPVIDHLPVIEEETQTGRREIEEVAYRAMALLAVAAKGEGVEQETIERVIEQYGLAEHFSPDEQAFLADTSPSDHDRIQFVWRYEAAWVLLWALGYVDELKMPTEICDVPKAVATLRDRGTDRFIAEAALRPMSEILDQADLIYRYHWAVVDARINGRDMPAGLDSGVVMERHHTLNWLIGYLDQEWDDISTDT